MIPDNVCPIPYYDIHEGGELTDQERKHLEQKLSRQLEWVGAWIPDRIRLDHEEMPLHKVIWNIVNKEDISDNDRDLLLSLEEKLTKKFDEDLESIKYEDTMENQAIRDYCEALGLLRAIITLKDIILREEKPQSKDELVKKMRESTQRRTKYWLDFLKQVK